MLTCHGVVDLDGRFLSPKGQQLAVMTEASIIDCCIIVAMGFDGHQGVHIPHSDCGVVAARQEVPATPMHAEELEDGWLLYCCFARCVLCCVACKQAVMDMLLLFSCMPR